MSKMQPKTNKGSRQPPLTIVRAKDLRSTASRT